MFFCLCSATENMSDGKHRVRVLEHTSLHQKAAFYRHLNDNIFPSDFFCPVSLSLICTSSSVFNPCFSPIQQLLNRRHCEFSVYYCPLKPLTNGTFQNGTKSFYSVELGLSTEKSKMASVEELERNRD